MEYLHPDKVSLLIEQANKIILIPVLPEGEFKEEMKALKEHFSELILKHVERIENKQYREFLLFVANFDNYTPEERFKISKSSIDDLL